MSRTPVLEMRNIAKAFGKFYALKGVDLTVWPGEIHALMGENGAGKSTLMKILAGAYTATSGEILIDGQPFHIRGPKDALSAGITLIYQEMQLAPNLTVVVMCWFILRRTTLGVHIYAVGGNMQAARLTGIKVWLVLLFVYGMSGVLSGLGGVMSASRLYSANGNLGMGYELDAIAAVILGGTSFVGGIGTITGTLVGALIIATLNNGMTLMGVSYFWQLVIKGAVIIIAVLIDKYRTRHHQSA